MKDVLSNLGYLLSGYLLSASLSEYTAIPLVLTDDLECRQILQVQTSSAVHQLRL